MRILAYITKIEAKDEFFVVTAKDVRKRDHSLFFNKSKWNQIINEYGCDDVVGLSCILENTECGNVSRFLQTDTRNKPIFTDNE